MPVASFVHTFYISFLVPSLTFFKYAMPNCHIYLYIYATLFVVHKCEEKRDKERMVMKSCKEELMVLKTLKVSAFAEERQRRCAGYAASSSLSARERQLVCVTSGNSNLGSHLVKELLAHGYLVRVTIQNEVDFEDMKLLISNEEMNQLESVLVAKMGDMDSLCDAFRGCHAIFHTSSFIDPHGVSGYSERMAFLETEAAKNVIEACGRAAYVKRCIFTSSLLASVWNDDSSTNKVVDETCWSNEEFCRDKKLWLALGKTRAEKFAWRKAKEMKVKLVTVCPGLLMAPSFPNAHNASSLPYLKGGKDMLRRGFLAIEDVKKVAKAHRYVYEAMDDGACGRYLSFDRVITSLDEAIQLENGLKMHVSPFSGRNDGLLSEEEIKSKLNNSRLNRLIFRASHQRVSCNQ